MGNGHDSSLSFTLWRITPMVLAANNFVANVPKYHVNKTNFANESASAHFIDSHTSSSRKTNKKSGYFSSDRHWMFARLWIRPNLATSFSFSRSLSLWIKRNGNRWSFMFAFDTHFSILMSTMRSPIEREPFDALEYCTQTHLNYWIWMVAVFFSSLLFSLCLSASVSQDDGTVWRFFLSHICVMSPDLHSFV